MLDYSLSRILTTILLGVVFGSSSGSWAKKSPLLIQPSIKPTFTMTSQLDEQSLDGMWQVKPAMFAPATSYLPQTNLTDWSRLSLPNNWYLGGYTWSGAVWHARDFDVDAAQLQQQTSLRFEAVDYTADVWLNGHFLGSHRGYFEPFSFDVTGLLLAQNNRLVVRVDSPDEMPDRIWSLHKQLIKGVLNHHDTRPGGAWSLQGQDANSGGIWQSVKLHFAKQASLEQVSMLAQMPATGTQASLQTSFTLQQSQVRTTPLRAVLHLTPLDGHTPRQSFEQTIAPVTPHINLQWSNLTVARWWPKELGAQTRYRVQLELWSGDQRLDQTEQVIGFRHVTFDKASHAFLINGQRFFLRGTNYIPSPWLASMSRADYQRDVRLMQEAHLNAVRVHAHVTGREFYELADEMGLLVWQDFPLQWGYDDSPEFEQEAARQAKAMTALLAHHASIFAWSAHNEPPWNADWMKYKYPDYEPTQNWTLTHTVAQTLAQDRTRYTHAYSATGEHLWMGWYSGHWRDHQKNSLVSIVSEFGAQALPDVETLKRIVPNNDLWPASTDPKDPQWKSWEYHNFQPLETFRNAKISRGDSLESFVQNSQAYQARLVQLAAESYRRQRYRPVAAAFHFMFNETWPSINWGIVDFERKPKQGYQALQMAYQPILPSIATDQADIESGKSGRFVLWMINDTPTTYDKVELRYQLINQDHGKTVEEASKQLVLDADSGRPVWELTFKNLADGHYQLISEIEDSKQHTLGSNQYNFMVGQPK